MYRHNRIVDERNNSIVFLLVAFSDRTFTLFELNSRALGGCPIQFSTSI